MLLGDTIGFTLTLAGIAGAIVAIGITADSFVVYFERIRDEMRDGRSLRVAVETGWVRARRTILAADSCRCSPRSCSTCCPSAASAGSPSPSA